MDKSLDNRYNVEQQDHGSNRQNRYSVEVKCLE